MSTAHGKLRKTPPSSSSPSPSSRIAPIHWLFRSNIPRKRSSYISVDVKKRNFFGVGEIIGVLANPAETLRSLTESKKLLDETRRELAESKERAQLRPTHTFARLPGFFPRKREMRAVERALRGEPAFTVLFGASSVGKTALLREVLSRPEYHVLHFDLRIAGFADLASLYTSLSQQMELYFEQIAHSGGEGGGYEVFEREAWGFKHDRLNVERRISENSGGNGNPNHKSGVRTSDIARLMELFQSSLLKYWEFQPLDVDIDTAHNGDGKRTRKDCKTNNNNSGNGNPRRQASGSGDSNRTHVDVDGDSRSMDADSGNGSKVKSKSKTRWGFGTWGKSNKSGAMDNGGMNEKGKDRERGRAREGEGENEKGNPRGRVGDREGEREGERKRPVKKMPVIFFDEAHKLPALIQSSETMKCLLDSMLVLTKQDRLCHVIHATSDPYYQTWLRQLNVMQHCKIITIGDCSKAETRKFFHERVIPRVPERMRAGLVFEVLYDAFGGKLAHWHDYITDYVNSNGTLDIKQSSHFLQAHALLNLHIIHSSQAAKHGGPPTDQGAGAGDTSSNAPRGTSASAAANASTIDTLHPALGPAGFKIYSPITHPAGASSMMMMGPGFPFAFPFPYGGDSSASSYSHPFGLGSSAGGGGGGPPEFTAMELLKVMSRLARADTAQYLPYFHLCRELGVRAVDGMVKGRVLDLRWTETVTREGTAGAGAGVGVGGVRTTPAQVVRDSALASQTAVPGSSSGTPIDLLGPPPPIDDDVEDRDGHAHADVDAGAEAEAAVDVEEDMEEDEDEEGMMHNDVFEEVMEVVGPKLLPTTPIMRYAMRDVVREYEDDQSVSEYASLSDADFEEY